MKLKHIIFSLLSIQLTVLDLQAMELGDAIIGGTGCNGPTQLRLSDDGRLTLPIRARVNKKSDVVFDRKSCNIRIPVTGAPNEKLQLLDVAQVVRVVGYVGADIKSTLNVSLVGVRTSDLILAVKAIENNVSVVEVVRSENAKVLAESVCGKDTMLTANVNILATGEARAFASTGATEVTLRVVNCDN